MKSKRIFNLDDFETNKVKDLIAELRGYTKIDLEAWREENRKKQAAGVKFDFNFGTVECPIWGGRDKSCDFSGNKEDYREVPQEVSGTEYARAEPHAAERALWKAQREAGTNEVWQCCAQTNVRNWVDLDTKHEPNWVPGCVYRVKPMKLTAKIIRRSVYKTSYYWEFFGTREEYRAECKNYGYVVLSKIKEVKPKTVKYYFALYKSKQGDVRAVISQNKTWIEAMLDTRGYTIIGDIEERVVEI